MKLPFQSIRWRIQAWHGLILLVAIGAFCVTAYQLAWLNQMRRIDRSLQEQERELIRNLIRPPQEAPAPEVVAPGEASAKKRLSLPEELLLKLRNGQVSLPSELSQKFSGQEDGHYYYAIADTEGRILLQSGNAPGSLRFLPLPRNSDMNEEFRTNGTYRESAHSSPSGLCSLVGRDMSPETKEMHRFAWSLGASGLALWIFGLLGGWWIAGKAIQPIQAISKTASRIADGNLDDRISTTGTDSELDQLSHVLNHTFDRLNAALERQRQFTADASHELRTPLTILLSESQRMRKPTPERTPEEFRESFSLCYDATMRMRHLVESLLLLARQDTETALQKEVECDLATLARDSILQLKPLADSKEIQLEYELEHCEVKADPDILMVVLNNLIGNAIQHHQGNGKVEVCCGMHNGRIELRVCDDGPGIAKDDLPRIFDRFYRADKSRSSQEGHSGLGLALVKSIIQNMGGRIQVRSELEKGSEFCMHLPGNRTAGA
ncbi:sensor histidine kinase [Coraliomargarita parva]|uniref:sensor histidine kinase n=1 Tax=Coraliomargarita parva TaxID=3014050 RepID=UPI0022B2EBCD|nr:HAMP domain-containing sensor histidine kinase [Coraliomargarita parva]